MGLWASVTSPFRTVGGRFYEATATRKGRRPVCAPRSGPNSAVLLEGTTITDRSYALERNEAFIWRGLNALCAMMVGTGVQPESQVADPKLKGLISELWDDWVDEADADGRTDFYGLQVLALRGALMGGDTFGRKRSRLPADGLSVPLQVQLLEAAMVPREFNSMNGANVIRGGIELGPIGDRAAYWVYPIHPNDFAVTGVTAPIPVRIPADQIVHLHELSRAGQLRGEPRLARLIVPASDFHAGEDAVQKAWTLAASITGTIEMTNPEFVPLQGAGDKPDAQGTLEPAPVEANTLIAMQPGEQVNWQKPAEVGATYATATKLRLRRMAAGLGIPYETLSQDLEGVSYSSIRAGLVQVWGECDQFLWQTLVPQFCRPIWLAWLDAAVASGALPISPADYATNRRQYTRASWNPPKRPWVDPLKDVQADILAIEAGLKSRDEVIRSFGRNPAQVDQERKNSKERAAGLGIPDEVAAGVRPPTQLDPGAEPAGPVMPAKRGGKQAA